MSDSKWVSCFVIANGWCPNTPCHTPSWRLAGYYVDVDVDVDVSRSFSRFGCCPDGLTAATGPNLAGCFICEGSGECDSCEDTKYGCCPDKVRAATGPDGAGCEDMEEGESLFILPLTLNVVFLSFMPFVPSMQWSSIVV
jgi:hypothetical protein